MKHVRAMKPEHMFAAREELAEADWVLFPEEWQINPLVHVLGARIFPSIASYRFGQDKVQFTRAMWLLAPAHVPETLIRPMNREGCEEAIERFGFPFVVKHPRSSMGQGVWLIENRAMLEQLQGELDVLYAQEYLEMERDLRVVWLGDEVVCAYWRVGSNGFHNNIARGGAHDFSDVPAAALDLARHVAQGMGIDHAGFDLACVDGHWYFLEANVRFGNDALRAAGIDTTAFIEAWIERNSPLLDDPQGDPGDGPRPPELPDADPDDEPPLPIAC